MQRVNNKFCCLSEKLHFSLGLFTLVPRGHSSTDANVMKTKKNLT